MKRKHTFRFEFGPGGPHGPHGPHGPGDPPPGPHEWRIMFEGMFGQPIEKHWMFGGRRFKPWQDGEIIFNPFVSMVLSKGGGLLPIYVLHLLSEGPRYGNELMSLITERTGGSWDSNPGAIYPLLNELEEQKLVTGEWEDPDKRTVRRYQITEAGREELDRLKAVMRPRLREALEVLKDMLEDMEEETEDE